MNAITVSCHPLSTAYSIISSWLAPVSTNSITLSCVWSRILSPNPSSSRLPAIIRIESGCRGIPQNAPSGSITSCIAFCAACPIFLNSSQKNSTGSPVCNPQLSFGPNTNAPSFMIGIFRSPTSVCAPCIRHRKYCTFLAIPFTRDVLPVPAAPLSKKTAWGLANITCSASLYVTYWVLSICLSIVSLLCLCCQVTYVT